MATDTGSDIAQQQIDLKILTNTSHSLLRYSDLAANTTVGQLKAKIHDELGPPMLPQRMRLIYRGRFLPNDGESLQEVFGAENIKQTREQNLHLVIPDQGRQDADQSSSTLLSRPTSMPPPQTRPSIPSTPSQTNPFRAQQQVPSRSNSQPQTEHTTTSGAPQPHDQNPYLFSNSTNPGASLPLPPEFANLMNQQLAAIQRAQAHALAHQNPNTEQPIHSPQPQMSRTSSGAGQEQNNQPRWAHPNLFQQVIAQQQQARAAAAGQTSRPGSVPQDDGTTQTEHSQSDSVPPHSNGQAFPISNRGNPVVNINRREGITPDGAHWISVNHTVHRTQQSHPVTAPNFSPGMAPFGLPGGPITHNPWRTWPAGPSNDIDPERVRATLLSVRREAESIRAVLTTFLNGNESDNQNQDRSISETQLNDMRARLDSLSTYVDQAESYLSLQNSDNMQSQRLGPNGATVTAGAATDASRGPPVIDGTTGLNLPMNHDTVARSISTPSLPPSYQRAPTNTSYYQIQNGSLPEVHLISGPEGPYALLLSSHGTYTSNALSNPSLANSSTMLRGSHSSTISNRFSPRSQPMATPAANQPNGAARDVQQVDQGEPGQGLRLRAEQRLEQLQQRPQNPQGVALAGHIWLAVRLIFFLYMFSGGPGWRRPLMIAGVSLLVWLFQIGIFNTPVNILRQHFEGLLPLPEERRREQQMQRRAVDGDTQDGQQGANPTPEEAARRLVQEREEHNLNWFRDQLRLVERAVALFIASLWPGLGERMVATREARLQQQREEEEQRERDAQAQAEAEAAHQAEAESKNQDVANDTPGEESGESSRGKGKARVNDSGPTTATSSSVDQGTASSGELTERSNLQAPDW